MKFGVGKAEEGRSNVIEYPVKAPPVVCIGSLKGLVIDQCVTCLCRWSTTRDSGGQVVRHSDNGE